MDDLNASNVFGVAKPKSNNEELFHRELERRSLDVIRVKNPDNKDFFIEWDKRYHRVPANGTADVPRYIAQKYCKDKAVEVVNSLADKMHAQELEDRSKKGLPPFESKWHEQQATYVKANYPRTDDKEILAKLYSEYWVGLVYEFGKDAPVQNQPEQGMDMTSTELKVIRDLENRRVDAEPAPIIKEDVQKVSFDKPKSKEQMLKEVTNDKG